jgi:hypothetical protein
LEWTMVWPSGLLNYHRVMLNRAMSPTKIKSTVADILSRTPEWIRHDLAAKDVAARLRAEETLAAMIAAAVSGDAHDKPA